jgi:hypothetical protein
MEYLRFHSVKIHIIWLCRLWRCLAWHVGTNVVLCLQNRVEHLWLTKIQEGATTLFNAVSFVSWPMVCLMPKRITVIYSRFSPSLLRGTGQRWQSEPHIIFRSPGVAHRRRLDGACVCVSISHTAGFLYSIHPWELTEKTLQCFLGHHCPSLHSPGN